MWAAILTVAGLVPLFAAAPCDELLDSVSPCTCEGSVLDCSAVRSGSQLLTIPGLQNGQSLGFDEIRLTDNVLIMDIPDNAFGNHYAVYSILIANNKDLTSVSPTIFKPESAPTLGTVSIRGGSLASFPFSALQGYTNLTEILLDNNKITSIPANACDGINSVVEVLSLDFNLITDIGEFAFSGIEQVLDVSLSYNKIAKLGAHALHFSAPIDSVEVTKNVLADVDPDFMSGILPRNTALASNLLTTLGRDQWEQVLADSLSPSARLSFTDNPFVCDCNMKWLFEKPTTQSHFFNIICSNILNPQSGLPQSLWQAGIEALGECP